MLILNWDDQTNGVPSLRTVALFGAGLIGRAIAARIAHESGAAIRSLRFDWTEGNDTESQLNLIQEQIIGDAPASTRRILSIVWSAGAGGFGSEQEVFDREIALFARVLSLTERIHLLLPDAQTSFHLLSSAGGIYEGQRNVGLHSTPSPKRPYGTAKLVEEKLASRLPAEISTQIYRPSSVYGYSASGRLGLALTLIRNGYQHRTTRVSGNPSTLRDFVHVSDVGRFIGDRIVEALGGHDTHILASGKPTSMSEIMRLVERVIDRRLYLQYDPRPSNAQDNTYVPSALGEFKAATSLDIGIKQSALAYSVNALHNR